MQILNVIHFDDLRAAPLSILKNTPWALFSGLFRPLFWEASSIIQLLAAVENTIVLLLFLATIFRIRQYVTSPHRMLIITLVVFVVLLCVFLTMSAPNFGTLSRYRAGYLSFFIFMILCDNPLVQYFVRKLKRLASH